MICENRCQNVINSINWTLVATSQHSLQSALQGSTAGLVGGAFEGEIGHTQVT